jgi:hypothetical protein
MGNLLANGSCEEDGAAGGGGGGGGGGGAAPESAPARPERASRRLVGRQGSTWSRVFQKTSLEKLGRDELLHVFSFLNATELVRLELVCKILGEKEHSDGDESEDCAGRPPLVSITELAAKQIVERTDRAVSFQPNDEESWKHLLHLINSFHANRCDETNKTIRYMKLVCRNSGEESRPQGHCNFTKQFITHCVGQSLFSSSPIDYYDGNSSLLPYNSAEYRQEASAKSTAVLAAIRAQMVALQAQIGNPNLVPKAKATTYRPERDLMDYLQQAASNGSAMAQYALACHFEIGSGVPLDRARAHALYESSANGGCELARGALARIADPAIGCNIPAGEPDTALAEAMEEGEFEPLYHPLCEKKWMDAGANRQKEQLDEYIDEVRQEADAAADPEQAFEELMNQNNLWEDPVDAFDDR